MAQKIAPADSLDAFDDGPNTNFNSNVKDDGGRLKLLDSMTD